MYSIYLSTTYIEIAELGSVQAVPVRARLRVYRAGQYRVGVHVTAWGEADVIDRNCRVTVGHARSRDCYDNLKLTSGWS